MSESRDAIVARRDVFASASPVTETMIKDVVHGFMPGSAKTPWLAPDLQPGDSEADWPVHLAKMFDFWSSVTLMTGRFKGSPMQAHLRVGVSGPRTSSVGSVCSSKPRVKPARPTRPSSSSRNPASSPAVSKFGLELSRGESSTPRSRFERLPRGRRS